MLVTDELTPAKRARGVFLLGLGRASERSDSVALPRLGLALVAYLLLDCPGTRAWREEVGAFLWERADRTRQAGNLRQLLFRIRAAEVAAGVRVFEKPGAEIALCADGVPIDLRRFRAAAAERDVVAVCAVYGGDLLAGLTARGEQLRAWLNGKRASLRAEFLAVLAAFVEAQAGGPVIEAAVVAAKQILEIDPARDVAYRILIRACEERGDYAAAAQYRRQRDRASDGRYAPRPPAPSAAASVERAAAWFAADDGAPPTAYAGPSPTERRHALPRAIVSAHAPSYASSADRELVEELGADLAIRLAQTRALTVLAVAGQASWNAAEADYLVEVHLAQVRTDSAQLRLLALPSRQILWASSFADARQYSARALVTLFSILRHIGDREVLLKGDPDSERFAYRVTLEAQRLLSRIDLPSIRRARRLLRSAQAVAPEFVPTVAGLARSHFMEWLVRAPLRSSRWRSPSISPSRRSRSVPTITAATTNSAWCKSIAGVSTRASNASIARPVSVPTTRACAPISPTRWCSAVTRGKPSPCWTNSRVRSIRTTTTFAGCSRARILIARITRRRCARSRR